MTRFGLPTILTTQTARRLAWGAAVALSCAGLAGPVLAQAPTRLPPTEAEGRRELIGPAVAPDPNADLNAKLRERGDLLLSDTTLRQALFTISESWHINLVVGEDVSGQVNGSFKNAPLHEILHSILFANGYGYRVVGQGLVVMKLDALGDSNPLFVTEAIPLRTLKPEDVIEGANLLRSPQGKLMALPAARAIMVVDLPERIASIRAFVQEIEASSAGGPGSTNVNLERRVAQFVPQFVKVVSLKESLEAVLSKDGKVVAIESENRLIVVDYPPNLDLAAKVMQEMDVARPQVRITALIYDVSLEDLERLGINWNHAVQGNTVDAAGNPEALWAVDSLTTVPVAAGTPAASMTFMNLSRNFNITATIDALCRSTDAQLLADPSITVVDREAATIQIVTEIPYQQLTQTQQGGNIGTTSFREAGVTLKVTPHIAADDTVQMEVTPTFSRLTGFTNGQSPQPIIDKRETQTTVRVADQQWLVIGGLRQRTAVKDDRAIPKLSGIKHLGKLFQAYDYSFRESELVVFLMPQVVTPQSGGHEREEHVLAASSGWLDQTPVAPHVLGHGEVGCPNCGQLGCKGCGKKWQPWQPQRRQVEQYSDVGMPPGAVVVDDRVVPRPQPLPQPQPQGDLRRFPNVENEAPRPAAPPKAQPPEDASASKTAKPSAGQAIGRTALSGPPLAPSNMKSSRRTANKATGSSVGTTAKAKPPAKESERSSPAKTAAKKESSSWFSSWWK